MKSITTSVVDAIDGFMCLATVIGLVLVIEWVLDTIKF